MSLRQGITTGLLGYGLRKERLGEALFFREIETYDIEVQVTDFNTSNANAIKDIQDQIKAQFALKSGDINIKSLSAPADYYLPNDAVRISKFAVQVERRTAADISYSNISGNFYTGINAQSFWDNYAPNLTNFSEEINFEKKEDGGLTASHNLSFGLLTGNKLIASVILVFLMEELEH